MSEIWEIAAEQGQAQWHDPGKGLCRATSCDAGEAGGRLSGKFSVLLIRDNATAACVLDSETSPNIECSLEPLHLVKMCKMMVKYACLLESFASACMVFDSIQGHW